jgi:hypothetical protein
MQFLVFTVGGLIYGITSLFIPVLFLKKYLRVVIDGNTLFYSLLFGSMLSLYTFMEDKLLYFPFCKKYSLVRGGLYTVTEDGCVIETKALQAAGNTKIYLEFLFLCGRKTDDTKNWRA